MASRLVRLIFDAGDFGCGFSRDLDLDLFDLPVGIVLGGLGKFSSPARGGVNGEGACLLVPRVPGWPPVPEPEGLN